jgi:hypothetical protein
MRLADRVAVGGRLQPAAAPVLQKEIRCSHVGNAVLATYEDRTSYEHAD